MRLVLSAIWIAFFALLGSARAASADTALAAAIDGAWREPQSRARDAYRHPYESLTFWGLKSGMTVVEVDPGAGGGGLRFSRPTPAQRVAHTLRPCPIVHRPAPRRCDEAPQRTLLLVVNPRAVANRTDLKSRLRPSAAQGRAVRR